MVDASIAIRENIRARLQVALKGRLQTEVTAYRSILSAIDNAGAVPLSRDNAVNFGASDDVPPKALDEGHCKEIIEEELSSRLKAIAELIGLGQMDAARKLQDEVNVILSVLADMRAKTE